MRHNFKKYIPIIMIFCISFISLGTSLFLLNGGKLTIFKNRLNATVVDSVPSGSIITDVEFYSELIDSYNLEKGTSYDYNHVFSTDELGSLETLSIDELGPNYHGHNVEDLSGLSYLTGLKNLYLKNINVSTIDLSHNTDLLNLTIYANGIETVDLSKNTKIVSVDVNIPSLNKLVLINNDSLTNLNTNKPLNPGFINVKSGKNITYLFGSPNDQSETINDNSFGITCDKYNIDIGETTNCMVKGKTNTQMYGLVFKLLKNNENISISDEQVVANLDGGLKYQLYGPVPIEEFNILSFKVTGVSGGSSKIYLDDYDSYVPLSYVDSVGYDFVEVNEEISKTFYVNKYSITNSSNTVVTTGILQTNYKLNIINNNGEYDLSYYIAVLGDVKPDGIIDIRDVAKAYDGLANTNYSAFTDAEIKALDMNNDGKKNVLDLVKIYDNMRR